MFQKFRDNIDSEISDKFFILFRNISFPKLLWIGIGMLISSPIRLKITPRFNP